MYKRFKLIASGLLFIAAASLLYPFINHYLGVKYLTSIKEKELRFSSNIIQEIENLNYNQHLQKPDKGYRIVLTVTENAFAELGVLKRIAETADKLGWQWAIIDNAYRHENAVKILNPDFIIAIRSKMNAVSGFTNFLYIHSFLSQYLDENGQLCRKYKRRFIEYDGFLQVLPNLAPIEEHFATHNKPFRAIKTYFTVSETKFNENPKKQLCFWGTALWDKARGSSKYLDFYAALDKTDYFVIYGPEETWQNKGYNSYKGKLPIENNGLIKGIEKAGIALVLHSDEHRKEGAPTARIFEAVAASAVVISDNHPFVKEHFGDSVLYVDQDASAEEMFRQIDNYVKWIHEHPKEALQKARAAHKIFLEKFTLEHELSKISAFYEEIKKSKKAGG